VGIEGELVVVAFCLVGVASPGRAAEEATAKEAQGRQVVAAQELRAIVHGFYIEGQVGGGYALVSAKVAPVPDPTYPGLRSGDTEALGAGAVLQVAIGYDLVSKLALELVGGASMITGGRTDKVRDLALAYAGAAARLALPLSERTNVLVGLGGAYVQADDAVDPKTSGFGVLGRLGVEYYLHVRHFSAGASVQVLAPLSPQRLLVSLTPHLRYTF
jgi:hypothetical protein